MSDDDKEYLRKHNIHVLLDVLAKELIHSRPDNPQQFVVDWLKSKEQEQERDGEATGGQAGGGAAGAEPPAAAAAAPPAPAQNGGSGDEGASGRSKAKIVKVSIPDEPQSVTGATLRSWLAESADGVVVVDVRAEQRGGRIGSSKHIPHEAFLRDAATYAAEWAGKTHVVFCCSVSPDLDQPAATAFQEACQDAGNADIQVNYLLGGLRQWMSEFGTSDLTVDYDREAWRSASSPRATDRSAASDEPVAEAADGEGGEGGGAEGAAATTAAAAEDEAKKEEE
eukprot:Rhum_TRINITY_DN12858_c0_g1::Rhum_TRINITY_DN12858_c0_g1_i1::g.54738::m.54738